MWCEGATQGFPLSSATLWGWVSKFFQWVEFVVFSLNLSFSNWWLRKEEPFSPYVFSNEANTS